MRLASPGSMRKAGRLLLPAAVAAILLAPAAHDAPGPGVARGRFAASISIGGAPAKSVHLFAFNDLHGYIVPGAAGTADGIPAGGAAQFFNKLHRLRSGVAYSATVASGDDVGASPLASALFNDEPTLDILTKLQVDFSSVGNHEFDEGKAELVRKQNGGCNTHDPQACVFDTGGSARYPGTKMQYLAANVKYSDGPLLGQTLFPPYAVKDFGGTKIGFIGLVLRQTPTIVTPAGVAGLSFEDEASTANALVPVLQGLGVKTIVLLIHQGGFNAVGSSFNACNGFAGDITPIADQLSPAISVILSGHTHAEYNCAYRTPANGTKLITSALSFGRVITDVTLKLAADGSLVSASALNNVVDTFDNTIPAGTLATYDKIQDLVNRAATQSAPLANRVIGSITADITRATNPGGESGLGDVIADSQLLATNGTTLPAASAVVAFMNPGGIRNDLLFAQQSGGEAPGQVTYGEAFNVQPFGNSLVTKTLTGAQIVQLLNQQFAGCFGQLTNRTLQVSVGFHYTIDASRPACDRIVGVSIAGVPLDGSAGYRVTMNSFLSSGGDGFTTFNLGTSQVGGPIDIDAQSAFFAAHPAGVAPGPQDRVSQV